MPDEIFPCNRFSPPKRDEKVNWHINLKKFIKVHFNRSNILLLYFTIHMMSICAKKVNKILCRNSSFYESMSFCKLTSSQRKIKRISTQILTSTRWKIVPPCPEEIKFPQVIVAWDLLRLNWLKFHPGQPGSCKHHLIFQSLS